MLLWSILIASPSHRWPLRVLLRSRTAGNKQSYDQDHSANRRLGFCETLSFGNSRLEKMMAKRKDLMGSVLHEAR